MKKWIVLLCLCFSILCGCTVQDKQEAGIHRPYTSLYVESYAGAQWNAFTEIYYTLYPQGCVPLISDIELNLTDTEEMRGSISFRMHDASDIELWEERLDDTERYLIVSAILSELQDGYVNVYYGPNVRSENCSIAQLLDTLTEEREVYQKDISGLQRLLQELHFDLTDDEIARLWEIGQTMKAEYTQLEQLLNGENASYDIPLYSCFFVENAETEQYQVLAYVLEDEKVDTLGKPEEEYAYVAQLIMQEYAQIEQITFLLLAEEAKNDNLVVKELVYNSQSSVE